MSTAAADVAPDADGGAPREALALKQDAKQMKLGVRLASLANRNGTLSEKLGRADANKDGVVDADEIGAIIDEMVREAHLKRIYKFMTIGLFIVVAVLIGALTGITYGIVELAKDTKISNYNTTTFQFMTTRDGAAMVTGGASLDLADFRVLPVANLSTGGRRMLQASGLGGSNTYFDYFGSVSRATIVSGCNILSNGIASFIVTKPQQQADPITGGTKSSVTPVSVREQSGCSGGGDRAAISALVQVNGGDVQVVCDGGSDTCDLFFTGDDGDTIIVNVTDTNSAANPSGRRLLDSYEFSRRALYGSYDRSPYRNTNRPSNCQQMYYQWWPETSTTIWCCYTCDKNYDTDDNCGCKKDSFCFPASTTVSVLGRGTVAMDELRYGDLVLSRDRASGALVHRPVYLFGHRLADRVSPYVHISAAGRTLALSAGHFAPVCVEHCGTEALAGGRAVIAYRRGNDIRVGDVVMVAEPAPRFATVERVEVAQARGAFNPYVRGADLIVDGVVASPHSNWIFDSSAPAWLVPHLPSIYEVMLAPVYALYCLVGPTTGEWLAHGPGGLGLVDAGANSVAAYVQFLAVMAASVALVAVGARSAGKRLLVAK